MLRKNELVSVVSDILHKFRLSPHFPGPKLISDEELSKKIVERILSHIQIDNQRRP